MNERFLHYIWSNKLFYPTQKSINGETIEIISTGYPNSNAGADIFNAKIKIENQIWAGDVEFHIKASDWRRHKHSENSHFNSVILHVVLIADEQVTMYDGTPLTTIQIDYREQIAVRYAQMEKAEMVKGSLCNTDLIKSIDRVKLYSWLDRLLVERLERKCQSIKQILEQNNNDWNQTVFVTLSRSFGFGINSEVMQALAQSIPYNIILKHRDNLEQIEALLLGQASLLDIESDKSEVDIWKREYNFLKHKYSLQKPFGAKLKFLRVRPAGFPSIRLAQLAAILHNNDSVLSRIIENPTLQNIYSTLDYEPSDFWKSHYSLLTTTTPHSAKMSKQSINIIVINTVVPLLFIYGELHRKPTLQESAIRVLEEIKPENNFITKEFKSRGIICNSSYDSQAIIQLYRNYCQPKKCLQCVIGAHQIKGTSNCF